VKRTIIAAILTSKTHISGISARARERLLPSADPTLSQRWCQRRRRAEIRQDLGERIGMDLHRADEWVVDDDGRQQPRKKAGLGPTCCAISSGKVLK
jgi:hypothetical protein